MELIARKEDEGQRLDKFISSSDPSLTRSAAVLLIEKGAVTVGGKAEGKNYRIRTGDVIAYTLPDPKPLDVAAQDIPLDVVFEDEYLLVVNKPQGMVVHPAAGNSDGTLVNALLNHCGDSLSGINGVIRPGIVHRIDKDTSGLLIVAKTNEAHLGLAEQIKEHSFLRVYNGICRGHFKSSEGTVSLPIGRDPKDRKKMAVTPKNSKPAVTHYRVISEFGDYSFVEFRLETGRTHQIRVHMAKIGHSIVGDPLYSPRNTAKNELNGQYLHAKQIGFVHPITGERLFFDSELPERFSEFIRKNGGECVS